MNSVVSSRVRRPVFFVDLLIDSSKINARTMKPHNTHGIVTKIPKIVARTKVIAKKCVMQRKIATITEIARAAIVIVTMTTEEKNVS